MKALTLKMPGQSHGAPDGERVYPPGTVVEYVQLSYGRTSWDPTEYYAKVRGEHQLVPITYEEYKRLKKRISKPAPESAPQVQQTAIGEEE